MLSKDSKSNTLKKMRWNKNKKKNWKKKINLSAIEDGLDIKRLELRTGGLTENKANDELYFVEKKPESKSKHKREDHQKKRLTVDRIIVPDLGAVKPASRRNAAKFQRRTLRQNMIMKLHPKADDNKQGDATHKPDLTNLDIWSKEVADLKAIICEENEIFKHTDSVVGKRQRNRPNHLFQQPHSNVAAVQVAHPGASYNPSFESHQNLLHKENVREMSKLKKNQRIERAFALDPSRIATVETDEAELKEGLFDGDLEEVACGSDEEQMSCSQHHAGDRKTRKQRKREQLHKTIKKAQQVKLANKVREHQVFRIKSLLKEIKEKDSIQSKARLEMQKNKANKMPVLSSVKYEEPAHDLQLSSELQGSLRKLKPEGDILFDRYKSLQQRCIIEPRQKFKPPRRKYKVKHVEKRSFREVKL